VEKVKFETAGRTIDEWCFRFLKWNISFESNFLQHFKWNATPRLLCAVTGTELCTSSDAITRPAPIQVGPLTIQYPVNDAR
jgi:hypothetical protein